MRSLSLPRTELSELRSNAGEPQVEPTSAGQTRVLLTGDLSVRTDRHVERRINGGAGCVPYRETDHVI